MKDHRILSRDAIKLIAVIAMLLNHIANVFLPRFSVSWIVLTSIGYVTAVTMCFFLVEGVRYTRSPLRYALRLLGFALLSQAPFAYCFDGAMTLKEMLLPPYNMLFTLLLCFLAAQVHQRVTQPVLRIVLLAALVILSNECDWPIMAVCFTWMFLNAQKTGSWTDPKNRGVWISAYVRAAAIFIVFELLSGYVYHVQDHISWTRIAGSVVGGAAAIACSGVLTLVFYSGKRGNVAPKAAKWFFYIFYPAHLAVLALIHLFMRGFRF